MTVLDRPLAAKGREATKRRSVATKIGAALGVVLLVAAIVSPLNLSRSLRSLHAGFASGSPEGNYFALVSELGQVAAKGGGSLRNVASTGSGDNVERLARAAGGSCDVAFALAQDGSDFHASDKLRLIARLPKAESAFFFGKDADKLTEFRDLSGLRVGIGPERSGSERLAKAFFALPEFAPLGLRFSNHAYAEQLELARRGELDLALVVIDEDAPLVMNAVRDMGLQLAGFSRLDVVARRLPHFRTGRIGTGQYEAVKLLPPTDKRVLRVDTLIVGNGCAGRSATIDLLSVVRQRFPDIVRHNKETPNTTGLELADAAKGFFDHDGPELADEYVPWLVDVMPPANWAYIVMGVSLLFNAMGAGHRFRLWRIDDARVKLESELAAVFGHGTTLGDISRTDPDGRFRSTEVKTELESLIARLEALAARSRRQSLSVLVPMGQEMAYRYQEEIINTTLAILRDFVHRVTGSAREAGKEGSSA